MTINLDTEIVSTGFNPFSRMCSYTLERDGRRWTVDIHLDDLNKHGPVDGRNPNCPNKMKRRNHLGNVLQQAMLGPPDPAPETK